VCLKKERGKVSGQKPKLNRADVKRERRGEEGKKLIIREKKKGKGDAVTHTPTRDGANKTNSFLLSKAGKRKKGEGV